MEKVKLVSATSLVHIANAIRFSRATHKKSDSEGDILGDKDLMLIRKIAFGKNHSSVLEHSMIIFNVNCSAKCLLELSRHRIGVSMTVTSSRYALRKIQLKYEKTRNQKVNAIMNITFNAISALLEDKDISLDDISMALPASFIYNMQLTFNLRSLLAFLKLRLDASAHYSINDIANKMLESLPIDYKNVMLGDY
jgi:flavin-dependent thymidylate synthase